MTKAELVTLLGWRLGDRDDMAGRIDAELDFVQDYVLEAKEWIPWFLLSEELSMAVAAGVRAVSLPPDFLAEEENSSLWLQLADGSTVELEKMDFDVAARKYVGTGQPVVYARKGLNYQLFPIPELDYALLHHYYQKDVRIKTVADSKWLEHAGDVVAAEVGKVLAEKHIKDGQAAAGFAADAQAAWNRLYHKHISLQEVNQGRSMGGNT